MSRYKTRLAAGIAEEDMLQAQEASLRDKFEKKEEMVVYVESLPEKLFRIVLFIISTALALVGVMSLLLPETRFLLFEVLVRFIEEATGMVGLT